MAALPRRVLGHAGRLLAGDAASRVFLFGTTAYLARAVGVEGCGLLAFVQVLWGYGVLIADWRLGTSGVRDIAGARTTGPLPGPAVRTGGALAAAVARGRLQG